MEKNGRTTRLILYAQRIDLPTFYTQCKLTVSARILSINQVVQQHFKFIKNKFKYKPRLAKGE